MHLASVPGTLGLLALKASEGSLSREPLGPGWAGTRGPHPDPQTWACHMTRQNGPWSEGLTRSSAGPHREGPGSSSGPIHLPSAAQLCGTVGHAADRPSCHLAQHRQARACVTCLSLQAWAMGVGGLREPAVGSRVARAPQSSWWMPRDEARQESQADERRPGCRDGLRGGGEGDAAGVACGFSILDLSHLGPPASAHTRQLANLRHWGPHVLYVTVSVHPSVCTVAFQHPGAGGACIPACQWPQPSLKWPRSTPGPGSLHPSLKWLGISASFGSSRRVGAGPGSSPGCPLSHSHCRMNELQGFPSTPVPG